MEEMSPFKIRFDTMMGLGQGIGRYGCECKGEDILIGIQHLPS